jgi:uncharacterized protein YgiM (DUF1202 family)
MAAVKMSLKGWGFTIFAFVAGLNAIIDNREGSSLRSTPASITIPTPTTEKMVPIYETLYVTGSVVNVRSGPSTSYSRRFQLKRGDRVQMINSESGWVNLIFDGQSGWMSGKYLSSGKPQNTPQKVKIAKQRCHPNYKGACVPIARDVDCAGGSGNGPAFVRGPLRVIGPDVYGLDRDRDGIGCE